MNEDLLNQDMTLDIIKEVINIGVGDAAAGLSELLQSRVYIKTPEVSILDSADAPAFVQKQINNLGIYISQTFSGRIHGKTLLFYTRKSCQALIKALLGKEMLATALSDTAISTLQEIGNILMVSCVSNISNLIEDNFSFQIPDVTVEISEGYFENVIKDLGALEKTIVVRNQMVVKDKEIEGYIFLLLGFDDFVFVIEKMQNRIKNIS